MTRIAVHCEAIELQTVSGTQMVLRQLLPRWRKAGHELTLVARDADGARRVAARLAGEDWDVRVAGGGRWRSRLAWLAGRGDLSKTIGRHDLWLSGWHWPLGRHDTPFVGIVHDLNPLEPGAGKNRGARARAYAQLYRRSLHACARRARGIVAISAYTHGRLRELCGKHLPPCRVIHHGVDFEHWSEPASPENAREARRVLGVEGDMPYVLCLGQHTPNKNHATLLEAFARIAAEQPELALVLAGAFNCETPALRRRAEELKVADRVRVPGPVPGALMPAALQGAAVFALPSFLEGFGLPLLEAFAAGVPVVCSSTGALHELAGNAALTVDPADPAGWASALQHLLSDPSEARAHAAVGRDQARRMSWDTCAAQYLEFFDEVLGNPPARPA
ncbi:MAG: glycosyltransferase family 4 protein [bacterium]|nr:glycosyltransferase family 4 protein [bacterium]